LSDWTQGPLGRLVVAAEAQLLATAMDDIFGLELLQLGRWGAERELLRSSRTRHQSVIATSAVGAGADLLANPARLPICTGSVDAILLPHCLEIEADPQAVLREADRVLVGQGHLVLLGFRPCSLWGLRAAASRSGFPPGINRFIGERRMREWLGVLGYEICAARHYLYFAPRDARAAALGAAEGRSAASLLRRGLFNPQPAGAYLLKARKRTYTFTPLRTRRRERSSLLGAVPTPTT